jgi:hypothetical protein
LAGFLGVCLTFAFAQSKGKPQGVDARDAHGGTNPEYLEITDKRLLTVVVTNRNSAIHPEAFKGSETGGTQ